MATLALSTTLRTSFQDAVERNWKELADQGFGVLTEIDMKAMLKAKLGEAPLTASSRSAWRGEPMADNDVGGHVDQGGVARPGSSPRSWAIARNVSAAPMGALHDSTEAQSGVIEPRVAR